MSARIGEFMVTYTGQRFYPLDPRASEMRLADVAHHLAMIPRFGGAVKDHYSVAEHCVLGSYLAPAGLELEFLMHDAAETWLGDFIRPLKHHTEAGERYREIEAPVDRVVREKWYLQPEMPPEVDALDRAMCEEEKRQVFHAYPADLPQGGLPELDCEFWPWRVAEQRFLDRYAELANPVRNTVQRRRWWHNIFQGREVWA